MTFSAIFYNFCLAFMTMIAAILNSQGTFDIKEVPIPIPATGEVLVKVGICGVCRSDLITVKQSGIPLLAGFPGHEIAGMRTDTGQQVAVLQFPGQGYAEYLSVPETYILPLTEAVSDILPEPLACAVNIVSRGMTEDASRVLIIGAGYMGWTLISILRYLYPGLIIDVMDNRHSALCNAFAAGASHTFAPVMATAKEATGGIGYDVVFEAVGLQETLDLATDLCTMHGRIVIAGYHQGNRVVNMQKWNWKGFEIINAHEREPAVYLEGLKTGLRMVKSGRLTVPPISHRYKLADINLAFDETKRCPEGFTKACIDFTMN